MRIFSIIKDNPKVCPYCGVQINKEPKRKFKCPSCRKEIYIQKINNRIKLITIDDNEIIKNERQKEIDKINSANNQISFFNAYNSGLCTGKQWLTSGKQDVRESHKYYENLGWKDMDYEYAPGLKYPGYPNCTNEDELRGCRCTIVFNVD